MTRNKHSYSVCVYVLFVRVCAHRCECVMTNFHSTENKVLPKKLMLRSKHSRQELLIGLCVRVFVYVCVCACVNVSVYGGPHPANSKYHNTVVVIRSSTLPHRTVTSTTVFLFQFTSNSDNEENTWNYQVQL